jgi:ubiquitin-conjugating enzyme E2 Z
MTDKQQVMEKSSRKRLQKDIVDIIKNPLTDHGIYYAHDAENMLSGYAVIFGPSDTLYRHGAYCFGFKFPTNYPFSPPKVTYLTNDGDTRFHPNLYRNGKVCISVLNTWKGEQWTSCQNIKSILLMLVTLFHNKPLLNEPGFTETNRHFISYNNIIRFRNLQVAILKTLDKEKRDSHMGPCKIFFPIYEKYIKENKDNILKYIATLKSKHKKELIRISVYNMTCSIDYETLEQNLTNALNNIN